MNERNSVHAPEAVYVEREDDEQDFVDFVSDLNDSMDGSYSANVVVDRFGPRELPDYKDLHQAANGDMYIGLMIPNGKSVEGSAEEYFEVSQRYEALSVEAPVNSNPDLSGKSMTYCNMV